METYKSINISINSTVPSWTHKVTQGLRPPVIPRTGVLTLGYFSIIICLVGLTGNVFMVWLFTLKMKKNDCTIYFLNFAVSDLLYLLGCGVYAAYMICFLEKIPIPKSNDVIIGYLSETLTNVGFNSSTFHLTGVSVERCLTVLCPLYNRIRRPRHQTTIVCAMLWALALLIMALEVFVCVDTNQDYLSPGARRCVPILIFTTVIFLLMLLLMVLSCATLLVEIQKTSEACRPLRLYVVILLSLFSFFIAVVPNRILSLLLYFRVVRFQTHSLVFYLITSICTALYCAVNPYINIFVGRWRERTSIKMAIEKIFQVNL